MFEGAVLKLFNLFVLLEDDAVEQLVLIVGLVQLVVLTHLVDVFLEILQLLTALQGLVGDLPHLSSHIGFLQLLRSDRDALLIESEKCLDEFKEEKIIVVDEGGQAGLGIGGGAVGVPLVRDFVSQIGDDFVKGLKVTDVLADHLLGIVVRFLAHKGVECFLVISNDLPGTAETSEHFGQILNPDVQVFVFKGQFLIVSAVSLQFDGHLGVLLDEQLDLKLLILHQLNYFINALQIECYK